VGSALLLLGAVGGLAPGSGAVLSTTYRYSTGAVRVGSSGSSVEVRNVAGQPVAISIDAILGDGTVLPYAQSPMTVPPNGIFSTSRMGPATYNIRVSAVTDRIIPHVRYTGPDGVEHELGPGDMALESQAFANGVASSATILDAADQLASSIGNNTSAFCPEGSVRQDASGTIQMYVTLFSATNQTVTINHITNKGLQTRSVNLQANVRFTEDVNDFLTGAAGPLAGQNDVDTSIEVLGQTELFLACPVYFNRSIGAAGPVSGGAVQDGNHN
jgi:hypothetical protein